MGKLSRNNPIQVYRNTESNPWSSTEIKPYFFVKVIWGSSYTCSMDIWAFGKFQETGLKYSKIMCRDTWKVTQSLQLHISHQMKLYPSVKVSWRLNFTCFTCIWALWPSEKTGPKYPKIMCSDTHKVIQSLQLHISHQVRP